MLNNCVLIGRLTKDPELRYTPTGVAVCQFTLAVDNPYKNEEPKADFIPIVAWKQTAEASANYLKKGHKAAIVGRIQTRNYENNEGRRIYVTEIHADNVKFLESRENGQQSQQSGQQTPPPESKPNPFADDGKPIDISDDDLPF